MTLFRPNKKITRPVTKDYLQKIDTSSAFLLGLINDVLEYVKSGKRQNRASSWARILIRNSKTTSKRSSARSSRAKKQTFISIAGLSIKKETHLCFLTPISFRINQIYFQFAFETPSNIRPKAATIRFEIHERMASQSNHRSYFANSRRRDWHEPWIPNQRCFEPFSQETPSQFFAAKTLAGLGLSIVKKLVEPHGGNYPNAKASFTKGPLFTLVFQLSHHPMSGKRAKPRPKTFRRKRFSHSQRQKSSWFAKDNVLNQRNRQNAYWRKKTSGCLLGERRPRGRRFL